MFCPNCGNDCKDAKFCIKCGTKIQFEEVTQSPNAVWSVGMPCPHCGGTKLDGNNCAFCGAQLIDPSQQSQRTDTEEDSYELPVGKYRVLAWGEAFKLENKGIYLKVLRGFRKCETRIRYDQICKVRYVRSGTVERGSGEIAFRYTENKDIPFGLCTQRYLDKHCISFFEAEDLLYYHIFCVLKTLAPPSAEFILQSRAGDTDYLESIAAEVDLDDYFERFSPYREPAVELLCKATRVTKKEAVILIDNAFDVRQKAQYAAEPMLAVRDLNRIIREKKRLEEKKMQELNESLDRLNRIQALDRLEEQNREDRKKNRGFWHR